VAASKKQVYLGDQGFRILKTSKKYDDDSESHSIPGVPKMFPTVAGCIVVLSAWLFEGGTSKMTPLNEV
jgi:hypothetical protein